MKGRFVAALAAALAARGVVAQPFVAVGTEFRVNTVTTNYQGAPAIAVDGGLGGFVIVWHSDADYASQRVGAGQRFDYEGNPLGTEFHFGPYTTQQQASPRVASSASGAFIVTWRGSEPTSAEDVFVQRYAATGAPLGPVTRVNTVTADNQNQPSIASDAAGNFVVAFQSWYQDGAAYGIVARRFAANGVTQGVEFEVNATTTGSQGRTAVTRNGDGKFVVAWESPVNGRLVVLANRYTVPGLPVGEFRVSTTTSDASQPSVAMDSFGDWVAAWTVDGGDGHGRGVFAVTYSQYGYKVGSEFRVNSYTTGNQFAPSVAYAPDGSFAVVWTSGEGDGSGYGVFGRRFSALGSPLGPEFRVSSYTADLQAFASGAFTPLGDFYVTWTSRHEELLGDVYVRRFCGNVAGDVNNDKQINVVDVLYLINHLFAGGPFPLGFADVNFDAKIDVLDVLYLINHLFAGGPPPLCTTGLA